MRGAGIVLQFAFLTGLIPAACSAGPAPATQPARLAASAVRAQSPSRSFTIDYTASISKVPAGARRLDLWLPVPRSDAQQTITNVRVDSPLVHEMLTEGEYGNRVLHLWSDKPAAVAVTLRFTCTRRPEQALPPQEQACISRGPEPSARLLQPDRLGVIDDRVRALARRITAGKPDTLGRARAIYDYVVAHMSYDKTAPGWGSGDTRRACDVQQGNCTDFHALFISLARASDIPARFGIGFQVPPGKSRGTVEGYHCWAEFWLPGAGWVPVDASEGWKHPDRRDFYFASLDDDRIRMSVGRDVRLPGARGEPLNYFLAPYAEIDGRTVASVQKTVKFIQP